jgi:hypothetical protein
MLGHIDRIIYPEQVGSLIPLSQDFFQTPATKKIMLGMFVMDDMFDMDYVDGLLCAHMGAFFIAIKSFS